MPRIPRYARDPEGKRRAILDAAGRLFASEGYRTVSIRRIAARVGYSPAAIYLHFPGKAAIVAALAEDGFQRFAAALSTAGPEDDPLAALEERLWRLYEFSKEQPNYFWLMFVDRSVPALRHRDRFPAARRARAEGAELVRRCVAAGLLPAGTNPEAAFDVLATAIHGAALSRLCGRIPPGSDADVLARDTLRSVLAGLKAGVPLESSRGWRG
jgi:AcrR family transcriptional regulator